MGRLVKKVNVQKICALRMKFVFHQENLIVVAKMGFKETKPVFVWILTSVLPIMIFVTKMPTAQTLMAVSSVAAGKAFSETVHRVSKANVLLQFAARTKNVWLLHK